MYKKLLSLLLVTMLLVSVVFQSTTFGAKHTHSYASATCTSPSKCSCGVTKGSELGHNFVGATCSVASKCSRCHITGSISSHNYSSYVESSHPHREYIKCSVCGYSGYTGKQLSNADCCICVGHNFTSPTCTLDGKCTRCGTTGSLAKGHTLYTEYRHQNSSTDLYYVTCSVCSQLLTSSYVSCIHHSHSYSNKQYGAHTSTGHDIYWACSCGASNSAGTREANPNCLSCTTAPYVAFANISSDTALSEKDIDFRLQINIKDNENDNLVCKYYLDDSSVPAGTENISQTLYSNLVTFTTGINVTELTNGVHKLRVEVKDSIAPTGIVTVIFIVDKTKPEISDVNVNTSSDSASISVSATDNISDSAHLQYSYTVGYKESDWISSSTYTITSLLPNTEYTVKFKVKDKVGHIASIEKTIRTKAQTPQISVNKDNIQKDRMELIINDSNPSETEYQIQAGSSYVTANGVLTPSPEWIKITSKRITVSGLSSNTPYTFTAKAKNSVGTGQTTGTTLSQPPANIHVEEKGINSLKISWNAVSNAIGYYVIADGKKPSDLVTSTEYTHSGLNAETNHSYSVSVKNAGGTGPYSFPKLIGMTLPNPPEAPVITDTSTTYTAITINWDAVANATGYEIEANGIIIPADPNTTYTKTTYTDEGLQPDSLHKYRVRSRNAGGPSDWSAISEISTMPNPPEIPENLKGTPTRTNITLTWNAAPRAEKYVLDLDGKSLEVGSVTSHVHEGLAPNTTYTYKIKALNKGGESKWSSPLLEIVTWPEIPVAPTNIMATAERDAITVTWYSTPFAESYDLEIDGNKTVNVKETSFTDKGLTSVIKHTYRIRSKNISGDGKWSNILEISTLPKADITTTEATLANIVAVVTNKAVTLAWQAVAVNAQYEVEVDGVLSDNGKETVYNHTGLKPLTFHTYRIRTKDVNGNGQWCAVLALSTLPNIPGAPSGVNAIAANTQIELRWNKEEETGYDVEVDGKVVDAGVAASYIDEALNPGTAHTYRVRGKNITGVTAWSDSITKSTISPAYEVDCIKGQEFKFSLLASNVQEFGEMTFVVTYNPEEIEVADLCEYTAATDVINSGMIPGTNITVKYTAGRIEFTVHESITAGNTWSGEITTILFKPKLDGKTSIEFNIE